MSPEAWSKVAVGEEAAIYAYGVLTAKLSGDKKKAALNAIDAHRHARDVARKKLASQDLNPSSPVVFELPFEVTDTKTASLLAATVELRLADLYLDLVAETIGDERQLASESAQASTASATTWGWTPTAFPRASDISTPPVSDQGPTATAGITDQPVPDSTVSPNDGATVQ
jgi:hypothetical protein